MRTRRTLTALTLVTVGLIAFAGCGAQEASMTPEEARDTLTSVTRDTADLLGVDGWTESGVPTAQSCDSGSGLKWGYMYSAPLPDADKDADVEVVTEHWRSQGMDVRVSTGDVPAAFATGGSLQGISFNAGPAMYTIAGTSLCVPGDANDYR